MNTEILAYCFVIFCFVSIAVLPFVQRNTVRARWAKFSMCLSGMIGVIQAGISLMLYSGWLVVDSHVNHVIHSYLSFSGGLFLGILFTLMFSGQLFGTKRDDQEIRNDNASEVDDKYRGPRCVACSEPVPLGIENCPKCGWTQPK